MWGAIHNPLKFQKANNEEMKTSKGRRKRILAQLMGEIILNTSQAMTTRV